MPCWEQFSAQDGEYQQTVLPEQITARVSIEAGATLGWERWIGSRGKAIGIRTLWCIRTWRRPDEEIWTYGRTRG